MNRATRFLSAAALLTTPLVAIAAAAPAAQAATSRIKVSVIGDQSVVGLRDAGKASHTPLTSAYRVNLETTACRQTVVPGSNTCAVIGVPNTALSIATSNRGDLGEVVVMATGYNDPPPVTNAINAVMTELTTHGVQKVIWLNLRVSSASNPPTGAQLTKWQTFNSTLTTLAGGTWAGKLRMADWNQASTGQDGWFRTGGTDPVQSQIEIRSNGPGPAALAGYIKGQIDAIAATVTPAPPPTPPAGSRCSGSNAIGVPSSGPTTVPVVTDAANSLYKAITPQRLLDTRAGRSALNITDRMLGTGRLYRLNVTDGFGSDVPTYATAVSLNVTVSTPCRAGLRHRLPVQRAA